MPLFYGHVVAAMSEEDTANFAQAYGLLQLGAMSPELYNDLYALLAAKYGFSVHGTVIQLPTGYVVEAERRGENN